jgi:electron transport complex protein RnfG
MKKNIFPSIVLGCICLVVAVLLSVVNMFTAPVIAGRQNAAANEALLEVLPNGKNFKEVELTADYPAIVTKGYTADGGCVFQMEVTGKSTGLIIMVGVDSDGKITGTKVIANQETPSYADKVFPGLEGTSGKYTGMTLEGFEPQLTSGATLTSRAYSEAVKAALQASVLASGGSVDTRTEEEKHNDACNLALGTTGKTFERWFMTETLVGVSNVYTCEDGIVLVIGDEYVGINNAGAIVKGATKDSKEASEVSADARAKAEVAYAVYTLTLAADYRTEVERPSKASKRVTKIELTKTGNYVMYMEGAGNGKNGEEYAHPSGEYIEFMVCISADGVIIDVMTTSRGTESEGFGDVCETDVYTEQFRGATVDNIVITEEGMSSTSTDLGIIAGATVTSNGYQQALQRAFKAFSLLTESN